MVHAERFEPWLLDALGEDRPERDEVGVDPGVRLHVRVVGTEQRRGMLVRDRLDLVDHLAARVEAVAGRALRVLVGEPRTHREQHRGRRVVLRRDELQLAALVGELVDDRGGDAGLDGADHFQRRRCSGGGFGRLGHQVLLGSVDRDCPGARLLTEIGCRTVRAAPWWCSTSNASYDPRAA